MWKNVEMGFFSGKYKYKVDVKNRINFKKFIKRLSKPDTEIGIFHLLKQTVTIPGTNDSYPVFYIFSEEKWQELFTNLEETKDTDELSEIITQQCDEANLDTNDRITFPKEFLDYIHAEKDLFLQGLGDKLQVWSNENFIDYSKKTKPNKVIKKEFYNILSKKKS